MKKLTRTPDLLPEKLKDSSKKADLYLNLRDPKTKKIRPRWNTITEKKVKIVRENLSKLSEEECAYCGRRIVASDLDVDHYLPSSEFPYLAYCWENYLPSCKRCNQALKRDYVPPALKGKQIIESCMAATLKYDYVYNASQLYKLSNLERLINPAFDIIEDHLEFSPEFFYYKAKTKIGEKTNEIFFEDIQSQRFLEKISILVKGLVAQGVNWSSIQDLIDTYGSSYYYKKYWEYWMDEKLNNRL
ncbi:HNH endonuclease [Solibacillus sp. FSL R7-0668]|uniref:HNH endonuclease n=1 Tax=Solibacillus sp. FSL R7-0668 TaxID=2921688 RepID=UPI0030F9354F